MGGGGEGSVRMSNSWAMVFDVDGCTLLGMHAPDSGDMLNYMVGPRWSRATPKRWVPYAQVLVGGAKITHDHVDLAKEALVTKIAKQNGQPAPEQDQYTTEVDTNGFSLVVGGGVAYQINDLLVWRVANLAYQRSWVSYAQTLKPTPKACASVSDSHSGSATGENEPLMPHTKATWLVFKQFRS